MKTRLDTDVGIEEKSLKKVLPEGRIPSLFAMLSVPSKLIGLPKHMSAAACIAMVARTAQP